MTLDRKLATDNVPLRLELSNMRDIVTRFLQLEIINLHPMVYWGLALVWLLLLVSALMSVRSLAISTGAKLAWSLVLIAVPVLGLAAYAVRCLLRGNWQALKPLFQSRRLVKQVSSARPSGGPVAKA